MKRALITGISGFVGPYLAKKLLHCGWEVSGLVRRNSTPVVPERLLRLGIESSVALHESDITDLTSILDSLGRAKPDVIFHLAAQSYVPRSFVNPLETLRINTVGTANLLEAIRLKNLNCKLVFAGSSEEYGLQFSSEEQFNRSVRKYGAIYPAPIRFPELPIKEENLLRPMSPYAVSKVQGDHQVQNYHYSYGMDTVVSRGFNHEGAGRGHQFVTASIVSQCVRLRQGDLERIVIGNVNAFRDWSHVSDIVDGYMLLADKGVPGGVYVQGAMRAQSVLTYLLMTLDELGFHVEAVETLKGKKRISEPLTEVQISRFGITWNSTKLDETLLEESLEYDLADGGLSVSTSRGKVLVDFDPERFRPSEVPILLSDTRKIQGLGFKTQKSLGDIIEDQINYYLDFKNQTSQLAEKSTA
jgi:GDP-mannose 4,6-dehydratase